MRLHFIAIGGSVMHNLAIALKQRGFAISGSDDLIYDPAKSKLKKNNLLPDKNGFFADKITADLDGIILGMHAKKDNPELIRALELDIPIYSYPEYIYEHAANKKRLVIAGSQGKTTITSMVMYVLKHWNCDFDYLVGAKVKGFASGVRLSDHAPVMVIEGDEYMASPIHEQPKFVYYKPHIAVLTGISWDHVNVYPEYDGYLNQFKKLLKGIRPGGTLIYNTENEETRRLALRFKGNINKFPYHTPGYEIKKGTVYLRKDQAKYPLRIFGEHNLQNLQAARIACNELGISDDDFYQAIGSFEGASNRLELLNRNDHCSIYRDFAHSPEKVRATVSAVKNLFPKRHLLAAYELHTFSSMTKSFLTEYKNSMQDADEAWVYFNPDLFETKRLAPYSIKDVRTAFQHDNIQVFTDAELLNTALRNHTYANTSLLLMTSGTFGGLNAKELADFITYKAVMTDSVNEEPPE